MKNITKATIYVFLCVVAWAFIPVVSKLGQVTLDNYQFLFWSSLFSLGVLAISTLVAGKWHEFKNYSAKNILHCAGLSFLGTFLYYMLLYYGYGHAQGLEVLVLQYTWPIFIVALAVPILKEKLTTRRLLAVIFGFLAVIVAVTKGNVFAIHLDNLFVDFAVLFAASVFGLFSVLSKKVDLEPFTMTTFFFVFATVFSLFSMLILSHPVLPTQASLIPIIGNGALINGLSYVFWLKALKNAEASYLTIFVFFTPILAALLLVCFFHEPILPIYILSLLLVLSGGFLSK